MKTEILNYSTSQQQPEPYLIAIRGYTQEKNRKSKINGARGGLQKPGQKVLVFDCETTTDQFQQLKFGAYTVFDHEKLLGRGLFYDAESLSSDDVDELKRYSENNRWKLMTSAEFVENVFFPVGYDARASIVGFNLSFDLSRLAVDHGSARRGMQGGFSLKLSPSNRRPRIQVKHLSARAALIQFTHPGEQLTSRGMRKRRMAVRPHRGFFVDLKTLAAALTTKSFTLASLAEFLGTTHQKLATDEHGGPLTETYLDYATQDVLVTWESYRELMRRFEQHGLTKTPAHAIKSEASVGKAYLREMEARPWQQVQPEFPPALIGKIMSTYYGGRSEIHVRRVATRVLYCDFLSMYPTVCTLMGLWKFVVAEGMTWCDTTEATKIRLERIQVGDLQSCTSWLELHTLVRIAPKNDILPVRAPYGGEAQNTIGLNHLSSDEPLWFTLADCIASKLLKGRAPDVVEAITFVPRPPQPDLKPVRVGGDEGFEVRPDQIDFYRAVIDRRNSIKILLKKAKLEGRKHDAEQLEAEQMALKILANATSYGIFVEINVKDLPTTISVDCYGCSDQPFVVRSTKLEQPGTYFHPLLATLITGAARLMLAITEHLAVKAGIDWAMCDTDSMALAKPYRMADADFLKLAKSVRCWFDPLNPYEVKGELLKLEEVNFGSDGTFAPLFCYAVSAKRYALFKLDNVGRPVIVKASAHGLGHLSAPYDAEDAAAFIPPPSISLKEIGVDRWQYDFWYQIIQAALEGHSNTPNLDFHPNLNLPALSRYGATTPAQLRWFKKYNTNQPYRRQVRPFGFLTSLQPKRPLLSQPVQEADRSKGGSRRGAKRVRPIAPYDRNPDTASRHAFDRETGKEVGVGQLATYRDVIAQYHLHPEAKFLKAEYTDAGVTVRRHIQAATICYIGKEANRWEEQFFTGPDEDAEIGYGPGPESQSQTIERVRRGVSRHGQRVLQRATGMSLRDISRGALHPERLSSRQLAKLDRTLAILEVSVERSVS